MTLDPKHLGSSLDEFLDEEGLLEHTRAVAIKRLLAYQIAKGMVELQLSKSEMAKRMKTSRSALDRLLDPEVAAVTLHTLERAAAALGKELRIEIA
jgi:DNA-binding Xre family transcriptional regulator